MKPSLVADEMFPEGAGPYMDLEDTSGTGSLRDTNDKAVHAEFNNNFDDLFDDDDLNWCINNLIYLEKLYIFLIMSIIMKNTE